MDVFDGIDEAVQAPGWEWRTQLTAEVSRSGVYGLAGRLTLVQEMKQKLAALQHRHAIEGG